jgi:hypothetical protein
MTMHWNAVPIEERLRNYAEKSGPRPTKCWIWQGALFDDGYGVCHWHDGDRLHQRAHRVSWMFHNGAIHDELLVLHHCDTPACINPDHLYIGTPQDNMDDKMERGRHVAVKGEDHGCARLTETDVAHIRYFLEKGYGVIFLADRYRVTHATIQHIRDWKSWKHVEAFRPSDGQPLPVLPPCAGPPLNRRRIKPPKVIKSKFRGVYRDGRKWRACINLPGGPKGETKHLGSFDSELDAARAYNAAIIERGLNKPLNAIDELEVCNATLRKEEPDVAQTSRRTSQQSCEALIQSEERTATTCS